MEHLKKIYRVVRWLMLAGTVITIFLGLKSPAPVAEALAPNLVKQNAESFQRKLTELATARSSGDTGTEVHFTAPEVNAAIVQATLPQPVPAGPTPASQPPPQVAAEQVPIKSTQVSFEDNVVKGQFLTEVWQGCLHHSGWPPGQPRWLRHLRAHRIQGW